MEVDHINTTTASDAPTTPPLPTEDAAGLAEAVRAGVVAQGDYARALAAAEAAELLITVCMCVGVCVCVLG